VLQKKIVSERGAIYYELEEWKGKYRRVVMRDVLIRVNCGRNSLNEDKMDGMIIERATVSV
jgi:hypothetical protein